MYKRFFALMLLPVPVCTGCFRREYDVQVINETPYRLDEVQVQMYDFKDGFLLEPGETSQVFRLSYRFTPLNLFAEGGLGLTVQKYSADSVVLPYERGVFITMDEVNIEGVNRFAIIKERDFTGNGDLSFGFDGR